MFKDSLWIEPLYRETAAAIVVFLILVSATTYFFKDKNTQTTAIWASLKSWIFFAPFVFVIFAFKEPWQLIFLILLSIYACKTYYQMVGMYHRSWFIWATYIFIFIAGGLIHTKNTQYFDVVPMIFLGSILLIPLIRNSASSMIQYMSLSLMGFIFFGWSFLHMGRILQFDNGVYIVMYIYILAEISENSSHIITILFGKHKLFNKITSRVSIEGVLASTALTILVAWALRHLLPNRSDTYWLTAALTVAIVGHLGNLIIAVVRRDLGLKNTGIFIIGRGDVIDRLNKIIFIAPVFYYIFLYLEQRPS